MSMSDEESLNAFKIEASELLEEAEKNLLGLDHGRSFDTVYNSIFRAFHSIKGAAGLLGLGPLKVHMHKAEDNFQSLKEIKVITSPQVDYFLKAIDGARTLLDGKPFEFNREFPKPGATRVEVPKPA